MGVSCTGCGASYTEIDVSYIGLVQVVLGLVLVTLVDGNCCGIVDSYAGLVPVILGLE